MKPYELTYLISSNLPENEIRSLREKINSFIIENQGILEDIKEPIQKKLYQPIKKERVVYLNTLNFQLSPDKLGDMEKKLKSENQIINYLILIRKFQKIIKAPRRPRIKPLSQAPQESSKPSEKPKKVELKEIEKKLEEILDE